MNSAICPAAVVSHGNFARQSVWNIAGVLIYYGCVWGQVLAIARLGGASVLGEFALVVSVIQPVFAFSNMNLRAIQSMDARNDFTFRNYRTARLLLSAAALVLAAAFCEATFGGTPGLLSICAGLAASRTADAVSECYQAAFQKVNRGDLSTRCLALRGLMNLLTLSVVFACSHRISTAVWTMALVSWLLLLHDRALFRHFVGGEGNSKPGIDSYRNAIRLAVTILPAGAAAMLSTLANNVPLYFLGRLQGNVAIGRFYPLVHAQFAGTIIVVALCQSLAGSMAAAYLTHDRESLAEMVRKVVGASLLLGIACLVGAELFGPSLMRSLYGEDFSVEPEVLRVFMAANGVAFVAAALGQIVLVTRQFDRLWLPYVAVPIVGTIGAALLVPAYGRMGVALSFAIVSVARCLAPLWIGLRTRDRLAPAFIQ